MEGNVVTAAEIRNIANCGLHIEDLKSDRSLTGEPTGRITIEGFEWRGRPQSKVGVLSCAPALDAHGFR
jgi:hypothetical protein